MSRKALSFLLVMLLVPVALGGSADDPELTDPIGDAEVTAGGCTLAGQDAPEQFCDNSDIGSATPSDAADLRAVWVSEPTETEYTVSIQTVAAGNNDTAYALQFNVTPTDISEFGGAAEHTVYVNVTDGAATEAPNGTIAARNANDDTIFDITLSRASTMAVGGDEITAIQVSLSHEETGTAGADPLILSRTDTTTDSSNATSEPFQLSRGEIIPSATLTITSTTLTQTVDGEETSEEVDAAAIETAPGEEVDATIVYVMTLVNTGTDDDDFTLRLEDASGALADAGITASFDVADASLDPDATATITATVTLDGVAPDDYNLVLVADSARAGGFASAATSAITVPTPPAPEPEPTPTPQPTPQPQPEGREVIPAGLGFLSPAAEAMGLDGPFGSYAELVLLALILLLLIIIIFLIIFLATRGGFRITVEPRTAEIGPGQTAGFEVAIENRKGKAVDAVARFEGDPQWQTGLRFGDAAMTEQGVDGQLRFGPKKDDSATRLGRLEVTAPEDAQNKESDRVTLTVARVNAKGKPVKPKTATVRVRAAGNANPVDLADVQHDPAEPNVGETVVTTASVINHNREPLAVRVVLTVDGRDIQERSMLLPGGESTEASFNWVVPEGASKVRVRVFEQ